MPPKKKTECELCGQDVGAEVSMSGQLARALANKSKAVQLLAHLARRCRVMNKDVLAEQMAMFKTPPHDLKSWNGKASEYIGWQNFKLVQAHKISAGWTGVQDGKVSHAALAEDVQNLKKRLDEGLTVCNQSIADTGAELRSVKNIRAAR